MVLEFIFRLMFYFALAWSVIMLAALIFMPLVKYYSKNLNIGGSLMGLTLFFVLLIFVSFVWSASVIGSYAAPEIFVLIIEMVQTTTFGKLLVLLFVLGVILKLCTIYLESKIQDNSE